VASENSTTQQQSAYLTPPSAHSPVRYTARPLCGSETSCLEAAYRLRDAVFARDLGWVPAARDGRERDRCDPLARHFAVFAAGSPGGVCLAPSLVGYARLLLPRDGLMLKREFAALLAGCSHDLDPTRAFEISRLVVHPAHRGRQDACRHGVVEHLARAIVRWALAHGRTEWLCVCEVRHVRALRMRGLPFITFGQIVEYQPGVPVCAARLNLPQAATRLCTHRPADYAWYIEGSLPPC
jgi:N-acyl-L-homoserine lactone synthetase